MADVKLPLSKPIPAHGETVNELTFREPTGADLIECGEMPFAIEQKKSGATLTHISNDAVATYIERLANIPASSVKLMAPKDFLAAFGVISSFFGDTQGATASPKPSSDTSS